MIPFVTFFAADALDKNCGTSWYRMDRPAAALAAAGLSTDVRRSVPVVTGPGPAAPVTRLRVDSPVLVFQRPILPSPAECLLVAVKEGRRVLVELDDDLWCLPAHDPQSQQITRPMIALLTQCCRAASGVIVSTPPLAARVRAMTGQRNVYVIPNAIDPTVMPPRPSFADEHLLVGWAGSPSHDRDFAVALPALAAVASIPGVRLGMQGYDPLAHTTIPHEALGWTHSISEHYRRSGIFDIALAPLAATPFNEAKSSVKWLESAYRGIPMVLSAIGPYARDVRDEETGLLASGPGPFRRKLLRLVKDRDLAKRIGEAARDEVQNHHLLTHRIPLYAEAFGLRAEVAA